MRWKIVSPDPTRPGLCSWVPTCYPKLFQSHNLCSSSFRVHVATIGKVTEVLGQVLDDPPKGSVLIHACNSRGEWGSGIALAMKARFPEAYRVYRRYCLPDEEFLEASYLATQAEKNKDVEKKWNFKKQRQAWLVGTTLLIPPQQEDNTLEEEDKKKGKTEAMMKEYWIACLFTSAGYGEDKDRPKDILNATTKSLKDLDAKIKHWEVQRPGSNLQDKLFGVRINSGKFKVEWSDTTKKINESPLNITIMNCMTGMKKDDAKVAVLQDMLAQGFDVQKVQAELNNILGSGKRGSSAKSPATPSNKKRKASDEAIVKPKDKKKQRGDKQSDTATVKPSVLKALTGKAKASTTTRRPSDEDYVEQEDSEEDEAMSEEDDQEDSTPTSAPTPRPTYITKLKRPPVVPPPRERRPSKFEPSSGSSEPEEDDEGLSAEDLEVVGVLPSKHPASTKRFSKIKSNAIRPKKLGKKKGAKKPKKP